MARAMRIGRRAAGAGAGASGGVRRRVAWRKAARLLAAGASLREAARRAGCLRTALARKLEHDPCFRRLVEEMRADGVAGKDPADQGEPDPGRRG